MAALTGVWGLIPQYTGTQLGRDPKLAAATLAQCLSLDLRDARSPPGPLAPLWFCPAPLCGPWPDPSCRTLGQRGLCPMYTCSGNHFQGSKRSGDP